MEAVILCGGLGTRLRALYPDTPKALAMLGSQTFIDVLLEWLSSQGVRRSVLATGYLSDQLQSHVLAAPPAGMEVFFSVEKSPLGTGGALAKAARYLSSEQVLALNGDSLCPVDVGAFVECHNTAPMTPTIAATRIENAASYGTISVCRDGMVRGFCTQASDDVRPGLANSGLYLLPSDLLMAIPQDVKLSLEDEIFPEWLQSSRGIKAFVHDVPFWDIGTPERLASAAAFFASERRKEVDKLGKSSC